MTRIGVALGALVLVIGGLLTYAIVDFHNWTKACESLHGVVEERYEYTYMQTSYTYNANGTVASVIIVPEDVYSYHCWVNHVEVDPEK